MYAIRSYYGRLFADVPQALENTHRIVEKVESYSLDSDPIMPEFPIPEDFGTMDSFREKYTESQRNNFV